MSYREELKKRTKIFAHQCVKLATMLPETVLGKHIRRQLIRAATSVAANYRSAGLAGSKPSFIAKLSIVIEEIDESEFWLEFITDENLLNKQQTHAVLKDAHELSSIFITSRHTLQKNLKHS